MFPETLEDHAAFWYSEKQAMDLKKKKTDVSESKCITCFGFNPN